MKLQLTELPAIGAEIVRTMDGNFTAPKYPATDKNFGAELRKIREERGFLLHQAAQRLGITTVQMSCLELGKRYTLSEIDKSDVLWHLRWVK